MFYILKKRLKTSKLCYNADFSQCLYTFKHPKYSTMIKILHNIDLFSDIFEFMGVLVHLKFLINLNCKHILRIIYFSFILACNLFYFLLILLGLFDCLLLLFLSLRLINLLLCILSTLLNQRLLFF